MPTTIDMAVEPSVHPGSFRAAGTLIDAAGLPVVGVPVHVSLTTVGGREHVEYSLGTGATGRGGLFHVTFFLPRRGTFLVEARFDGTDRLQPSFETGFVAGSG
jgi:hypothetical protein